MSGHVVDRFLMAAYPNWPDTKPISPGHFRASPEAARMLLWHGETHPAVGTDGSSIFGLPVVVDDKLPRGMVVFVEGVPA